MQCPVSLISLIDADRQWFKAGSIDTQRFNDFLQIAGAQLTGAMGLLDNLVEWGRIQLASATITTTPVTLKDEVQKVFNSVTVQANLKGNELVNRVPEAIQAAIDENTLQFILRNLVNNANKFTEKGRITIEAFPGAGKLRIQVTDTGIGMPPRMQERLFLNKEKHSRRGAQNESGSGLGLVLVKEFIEKAGGCIGVESQEGKGSCFTIELPVF